jgi:hypothetical protein
MGNLPQVVDAMAMISVVMRHDHCADADALRSEQLFAKIRPAVDQQGFGGAFEQDR